ncbi:helix-turn-helix domain-containing protein [Verrucosispora sioxanthis]|uniref:Helix-turn-helix transcriptional regulator n=1 Tax=Verrucosispora sioxanthis TaxID=2499994 RepID=A0A6M1KY02_9ACTN|nr:helix-turn-helix transcriptional regulator [Verrucosispora sioxanthis]NEE63262.1 helix-turn-helix transcriptional regulator [Verrucosispora sioxanthis]NGM12372.1 helix-turn-helix transcriptional regulator [Verrucosispora sioxanthis]
MSLLRRVIGAVLRRERQHQGRTLREVAQAAGVSVPYLSEVERGRKEASSEVLAAICRALGLHLSDLLEEVRDELRRVERRLPATGPAAHVRTGGVPATRRGDPATATAGHGTDGSAQTVARLDAVGFGFGSDLTAGLDGNGPHAGWAPSVGSLGTVGLAGGGLIGDGLVGDGLVGDGLVGGIRVVAFADRVGPVHLVARGPLLRRRTSPGRSSGRPLHRSRAHRPAARRTATVRATVGTHRG